MEENWFQINLEENWFQINFDDLVCAECLS